MKTPGPTNRKQDNRVHPSLAPMATKLLEQTTGQGQKDTNGNKADLTPGIIPTSYINKAITAVGGVESKDYREDYV